MTRTNYFPQLDSVRGLSFLVIFFFHSVHPVFDESLWGRLSKFFYDQMPLAIDVFFILSSFLLTWLGIKEFRKRNQVSLSGFFRRRILRIWPLYFVLLTVSFLLLPVLAAKTGNMLTLPDPLYYYFFIANYYNGAHVFFLQILWTISVEEQFYIFLGLALRYLYRYLQLVFFLLMIASISFSIYVWLNDLRGYFHTLTYCIDFAAGGLAALLMANNSKYLNWIVDLKGWRSLLFYFFPLIQLSIFFVLMDNGGHDLLGLLNRYIFIAYISLLLAEQVKNPSRHRFLEQNRFLILTGKISFGLYCFHGFSITAFELLDDRYLIPLPHWLTVILAFVFNFSLAFLSYRYLESPFLRLKERFRMI